MFYDPSGLRENSCGTNGVGALKGITVIDVSDSEEELVSSGSEQLQHFRGRGIAVAVPVWLLMLQMSLH
jgi:hypothetical protein